MNNDGFSLVEVTEVGDVEKIRDVWNGLAEGSENYTPFLCHEWFELWLTHFLGDSRLRILLLYEQDTLKMIAPFLLKRSKLKGISVSKLELIGNAYSPFRYFLFHDRANVLRIENLLKVFEFLSNREDWDMLDLTAIPEENGCLDVVNTALGKCGLSYSTYFCFGDWYLAERGLSSEEYFSRQTSKFRHSIRYRRKKIEEKGTLKFVLVAETDAIDKYMDDYYSVYSRSWQRREGIGPTFHRDLARITLRKKWLRLGFLTLDGVPIASQFWLNSSGYAYILKTVYDQAYKSYSPGKILTWEMMKHVLDIDKVSVIDYLHGDEEYKQDWTPLRRERRGMTIYNNNLKGAYLSFIDKKVKPIINDRPQLRKLRESLRNRKDRIQHS